MSPLTVPLASKNEPPRASTELPMVPPSIVNWVSLTSSPPRSAEASPFMRNVSPCSSSESPAADVMSEFHSMLAPVVLNIVPVPTTARSCPAALVKSTSMRTAASPSWMPAAPTAPAPAMATVPSCTSSLPP